MGESLLELSGSEGNSAVSGTEEEIQELLAGDCMEPKQKKDSEPRW